MLPVKLITGALLLGKAYTAPQSHDYIVVGGGTAGLVVANRLSANANTTVLVIEAGDSVYNNAAVYPTDSYGKALGTNLDYQYKTTAQSHAGGSVQTLHAGKAIGGTSTINGQAYTRLIPAQLDAWGALGNNGWSWNDLLKYYYKSENFSIPDSRMQASGASYSASSHGYSGPVKTGWPRGLASDSLPHLINSSSIALGVSPLLDVNSGNMRGFSVYPRTVDTAADVRCDAGRAYYYPIAGRKNLVMLANTMVTSILWKSGSSNGNIAASGVQTVNNGVTSQYFVNKEVILAAGTIRTPQLLELSGVGNSAILSKLNIPVKIDLKGVGENLQDQINNALSFSSNVTTPWTGQRGYALYLNATDVFGSNLPSLSQAVRSNLSSYANDIAAASNGASTSSAILSELTSQYNLLFTSQVPMVEIVFYTSGNTGLATQYWGLLPFARGSVHITSTNPATAPAVNPNYFQFQWDAEAQVGIARYIRRLYATAPLAKIVTGETYPGLNTIPATASDDKWISWLKSNFRPNYHVVGTVAMKPREKGGAVDARLKVYGTTNVRVVDASVWPSQVCGHLMSTIYAVAEKGSVMIMEDNVV